MTINPVDLTSTAKLTFAEDFNGFSTWNGVTGLDVTANIQAPLSRTNPGTSGYVNAGELEWYVNPNYVPSNGSSALPNPFSTQDGILTIAARPADAAIQSTIGGQKYTSGVVSTYHEFSQTYGYFEMRAELPAGQGLWPAFWLMPVDGSSPPEIDVIEMLGQNPSKIYTSVHSKIGGEETVGTGHFQTTTGVSVSDTSNGFHTYGVDWEPGTITWYYDRQAIFQAATPADANKPMYMIANLAVGGSWPGNPDGSTTFPADMKIDYIHAYSELPVTASTIHAGSASFAFALTEAHFDFSNGRYLMSAPDGSLTNLAGIATIAFADGTVQKQDGSSLVDDLFYFANNNDVWNAHADASTHYNSSGWHEGRDPNASFSTVGYLAANADVRAAGVNPLVHYDTNGWHEGRDPAADFDNELYLSHNPDVKAAGIDPLQHYLQHGQAEGRQAYAAVGKADNLATHPGFDAEYYLLSNPDVARAALAVGGDSFAFAYQHYETYGWHEGRNPNAVFDTKGYLATYADVKEAGVDPLMHYDTYGWHEGRDPSATFDTKVYEATYADVKAAGVDPMLHYLQYGALEGRTAFNDGHFA